MNQGSFDPYEVLGVARSAPEDVVRAAYKALLKTSHPDHATDDEDRVRRQEHAQRLGSALAMVLDGGGAAASDLGDDGFGDSSNGQTTPLGIAIAQAEQGRFDAAVAILDDLLDRDSASFEARVVRAHVLLAQATAQHRRPSDDPKHMLRRAEVDAAVAVAMAPDDPGVKVLLARIHLADGAYQSVVELIDPIVHRAGPEGREVLARALMAQVRRRAARGRLGTVDQARRSRAMELWPPLIMEP